MSLLGFSLTPQPTRLFCTKEEHGMETNSPIVTKHPPYRNCAEPKGQLISKANFLVLI